MEKVRQGSGREANEEWDRPLGFWQVAQEAPDRVAVVDPDGSETTFGELLEQVHRLSNAMQAHGLRPGDGVAVLLPNHHAVYECLLATEQIGLYLVPINYHLKPSEIAYILRDCEAKMFITHERFSDLARESVAAVEFPESDCFAYGAVPGFGSVTDLQSGQVASPPGDRTTGQVMLYTSGTTGRPKGVRRRLTGKDPDEGAQPFVLFARAFQMRPFHGAALVTGPLYHASPIAYSRAPLHVGERVVLMDKWSPEETLQLCERHRITSSHMVPTMFRRLLVLPEEVRNRYDVSSLEVVVHSAAPCPVPLKQQMMDWWGPIIWEAYGGSEGYATVCKPHHWLAKPGTVGRAVRGLSIEVIDEEGRRCEPGEVGTIYVSTVPDRAFEYFKDPEKSRSVKRGDEFFTLGDVGYLDDEGFLFLTDRKIDMIISGGVNVYPSEVEQQLVMHPAVADVAVIGVPNEEWGEQVKAVVEPAPGVIADAALEQSLIDFCREHLAHYKCPRSVEFRDRLPRYDSGKLYKRLIREEYWGQEGRSI